jgi:hypothetical protein
MDNPMYNVRAAPDHVVSFLLLLCAPAVLLAFCADAALCVCIDTLYIQAILRWSITQTDTTVRA